MVISLDKHPRVVRHVIAATLAAIAVVLGLVSPTAALAPIPFILVGFAARCEMHLDLSKRTYRLWRGLMPSGSPSERPFSDLRRVLVKRKTTSGAARTGSEFFITELVWVNGIEGPWVLDYQKHLPKAIANAALAVKRLGIPLLPGPGLEGIHLDLESIQYEGNARDILRA